MKEKSTKGIIFDLDGTLIDSYQAIYLSFRYLYEKMGRQPLAFDEVKRVIGHGLSSTFRDLLGEEHVPEALCLFQQKYEEVFRQYTYFLPGAREVLEALHGRGIKLAVATNKIGRLSRESYSTSAWTSSLSPLSVMKTFLRTSPIQKCFSTPSKKWGWEKRKSSSSAIL